METNNNNNKKMITQTKKTDLSNFEDHDLDAYFEQINKLNADDQIYDPRCKFCRHELRVEAEELWEKTRRFRVVLDFFQKNNYNMNINNIRTHIRNHYLRQEQLIMRRHYAEDRILPMLNHRISKMKRIETFLAFLEDKAWKYASMEHEDDVKAIKSDDMLVKITKEVISLIKIQAELEGDLKPIQIVVDRFQQIFVNAMNKIDDPNVRMEMTKELESLREADIIDA